MKLTPLLCEGPSASGLDDSCTCNTSVVALAMAAASSAAAPQRSSVAGSVPSAAVGVSDLLESVLFSHKDSIFDRFPDIPAPGGVKMLNKVVELYGVPGKKNVTIDWFNNDTHEPNFKPHPDNERHQTVVVESYIESIARQGVVAGVRGKPFALLFRGGTPPYLLITWGTLSRAFYEAVRRFPDNHLIQTSLQGGLADVTLLSERTPPDVYKWVRDYHNQFHGGSSMTCIQVLTETEEIEANWTAHCITNGVTTRSGVGENTYSNSLWAWLNQKYPNRYNSMNEYESVKSAVHFLKKVGCFEVVCKMLGDLVDFRNGAINNHNILMNIHTYTVCLDKIKDSVDEATLVDCVCEGLKFMAPLSNMAVEASKFGRMAPWILQKFTPAAIKLVLTPVEGSVVYTRKAKVPKVKKPSPKVPSKAGTGTSEAKAKLRKVKASDTPPEVLTPTVAVSTEDGDMTSRPKVWLDDVLAAIDSAFATAPGGIDIPDKQAKKAQWLSYALEFCWAKEVAISSKKHTTWSSLRDAFRQSIITGILTLHVNAETKAPDSTLGTGTAADAAAALGTATLQPGGIESMLKAAVDKDMRTSSATSTVLENPHNLDKESVDSFKNFVEASRKKPLRLQATYTRVLSDAWEPAERLDKSTVDCTKLAEVVFNAIDSEIKPGWMAFTASVGKELRKSGKLTAEAIDVFGDVSVFESFIGVRAAYVAQLTMDLCSANCPLHCDLFDSLPMQLAKQCVAAELDVLNGALMQCDKGFTIPTWGMLFKELINNPVTNKEDMEKRVVRPLVASLPGHPTNILPAGRVAVTTLATVKTEADADSQRSHGGSQHDLDKQSADDPPVGVIRLYDLYTFVDATPVSPRVPVPPMIMTRWCPSLIWTHQCSAPSASRCFACSFR